jgi:hypothetical protein
VRGHTLYVRAPDHIRTSVSERYLPLLRRVAAQTFDERVSIEVVAPSWRPSADGGPSEPRLERAVGSNLNAKYTF